MDLKRLDVFCKVFELRSFTRAAEELNLSQPSVSDHVRRLEDSLREKLFDRLGRSTLSTEAGKLFYQYAKRILQLQDEALQALRQYQGELTGNLLLGASSIPGAYILPRLIGEFKIRYPKIQITHKIFNSHLIADEVIQGEVELGVIGAKWREPSLQWQELFSDEMILVVYPEHRWVKTDGVSIDSLKEEPFILRERLSGTRQVMNQILADHHFPPSQLQVVAEMGNTEAVRQSIKARIGISILSKHAVAEDLENGNLVEIPIQAMTFLRPLYLIRRKNRPLSPLSTAFEKFLQTEASNLQFQFPQS